MKTLAICSCILFDIPKKSPQIAKINNELKNIKSLSYGETKMVKKDDNKRLKKERRNWKEMEVGLSQEFMDNFQEIFLKKDSFILCYSTLDIFRRNTG